MNAGHSSDSTKSELRIFFSLQNYSFNTSFVTCFEAWEWRNRPDNPLLSLGADIAWRDLTNTNGRTAMNQEEIFKQVKIL